MLPFLSNHERIPNKGSNLVGFRHVSSYFDTLSGRTVGRIFITPAFVFVRSDKNFDLVVVNKQLFFSHTYIFGPDDLGMQLPRVFCELWLRNSFFELRLRNKTICIW
jgi:hypothetical protein